MATGTSTLLTYEDLVNMPADGKRYEIIDGELYVNAAPAPNHQQIVFNLVLELGLYRREHGGIKVLPSPIDVLLELHSVVEPDIIILKTDRLPLVGSKNVQGAPDLVIEVLSPSNRRMDEMTKRKLYERTGVDEYWIVDPELEAVKIHRRAATGSYEKVAEITVETGGVLTTPLLPGLAIDINLVFAP